MNKVVVTENVRDKRFGPSRVNYTVTPHGEFVNFAESTDSYERYVKNLNTQPLDWYYRDNKVYYNFNSEGFRTKEFKDIDWNNSVVVFGCSNVLGIGLEEKNTLSSKIEAKIGIPTINMGIGGASILRTFNDSLILAENGFTPKAIVFIWSDCYRTTLYKKGIVTNIGAWCDGKNDTTEEYWNKWCMDETNPKAHALFNVMAARRVWQSRTKYFEGTFFLKTGNLLSCPFYEIKDRSRDLSHPGVLTTEMVSEQIVEGLRKQ